MPVHLLYKYRISQASFSPSWWALFRPFGAISPDLDHPKRAIMVTAALQFPVKDHVLIARIAEAMLSVVPPTIATRLAEAAVAEETRGVEKIPTRGIIMMRNRVDANKWAQYSAITKDTKNS